MIQEIELSKLKVHPRNVRKTYKGIDELAESIKAQGIRQNLTVVKNPEEDDTYLVVIGNRRLKAAIKAGIETAPCEVAEMDEKEQLETMLLENMQRDDLTIYEQAQGFQMVLDLGETEEGIAKKTGFSKTTVRRRLNIAKLDQKLLQEKQEEDGFQISLTDLYELEKIKSLKKRNQILKDARNSREITSSVQRIIQEEKQKANEKKIVAMLKKNGIEEAPDKARQEIYTSKWETVKSYSLREEPPKKFDVKPDGKEKLYYLKYWSEVRIIRKAKKQKRELTPEEKRRSERDSRRKKIKAMAKEMATCRRDFIMDIIAGKIKPLENTEGAMLSLWKVIRKSGAYLTDGDFIGFILGKKYYNAEENEIQEAKETVERLNAMEQTLIAAYIGTADMELTEWPVKHNEKNGKILQEFYNVLALYGHTYSSDNEFKLLNGTHELYTEVEID
ncbi:hypothetical protein B5E53_06950 [Eubacterium sp. An11]|uniref:ParB/RepB/Spo0J family partition protein n=1 Tax=Eubacterium sp. An11 TaxID=1965542 RepID=UPI000B3970CE|nr:ParB/RepB/Spo0J family partition protein [Eubacterium sp. An11]OUQ68198.1 hypothetical protein B5E53_06950 [Eubacterium sp. An11]